MKTHRIEKIKSSFDNAGELQICFPSRQTSEIILNLPSGREHFLCPEIESQMKTTSIKNYPLKGCTENIAIKYGVSVNHSERYSIKTASSLDPLAEKILLLIVCSNFNHNIFLYI